MRQDYTITDLKEAVKNSICYSDICRELGVTVCSFNFNRFKKLCAENNISMEHFDVKKAYQRGKPQKWTVEDALVENSTLHRGTLRSILLRNGLYPGECQKCGLPDQWEGEPLTIEIDHINGDKHDNRKENLRWLCPNCHSQTATFRRKNVR